MRAGETAMDNMNRIATNVLDECPNCGSDEGYYNKFQVTGWTRRNMNFDHTAGDNTEMWDGVNTRYSKIAYCQECHEEIIELKGI